MAVARHDFVREFLTDFYEHRFVTSGERVQKFLEVYATLSTPALDRCADELFLRSPFAVNMPAGDRMRLVYLREIDGSEFPFLLAIPSRKRPRVATCFLGHRFTPDIEGPLRFNLKHVLDSEHMRLRWSAQDLTASDLFPEIVKGIRRADMCFFDTRGTAERPNVYIEVGIAYAFGVPTILAEYVDSAAGSELMPSDFQGLFRIRYTNYQQLFRTLYFGLPAFMSKNRIRRRRLRRR